MFQQYAADMPRIAGLAPGLNPNLNLSRKPSVLNAIRMEIKITEPPQERCDEPRYARISRHTLPQSVSKIDTILADSIALYASIDCLATSLARFIF